MTTFIASLFLPYTIDLKTSNEPGNRQHPQPLIEKPGHNLSNDHLGLANAPLPNFESIRELVLDSFSSPLHGSLPRPSTACGRQHRHPGLIRTESDLHEWGQSVLFNQPASKAYQPPPSTIFYGLWGQVTRRQDRSQWTVESALSGNGALFNAVHAATKTSILQNKHFVGTLGHPTDDLDDSTKVGIEDKLENEYDSLAVFIGDTDFSAGYCHYCKTILWPVLHYQLPSEPKSKQYLDHSWRNYIKMNEAFAKKIIFNYKHGDTVWIHDYHLMLVPKLVRARFSDAKLGFVLHCPFPSSEIFRCLPTRKELLNGVLGADAIFTHTQEYAHHFLQTCSHLLLVEADVNGVQLEDRFVNVYYDAIGVVPEHINVAREDPAVAKWVDILTEKYLGSSLLVATDKIEDTKGVRQKLLAYESFLDANPEWAEKVVMIQVAISTTGKNPRLDSAIADVVSRIDARHSTLAHQPIIFLKQDIALSQYLAMLETADALIVTSLRDGMKLTCHEYIVCQDGSRADCKRHGAIILSEFTGAATLFGSGDILSVNPWDRSQVAKAIKEALEMSAKVKKTKYDNRNQVVTQKNGVEWIKSLTTVLDSALDSHQQRDAISVPRLSVDKLVRQYKGCSSSLFMLDYEGTLASWGPPAETVLANPQRVLDTLQNLTSLSDRNIVYISSSLPPSELESLFHGLPGLGLIAESGCFVRPHTDEVVSEDWIDLARSHEVTDWKRGVASILQYYLERVDGAYVEEHRSSLIFNYSNVKDQDAEAAVKLVGDCANHLNDSCLNLGVKAVSVEKAVTVELRHVNKMTASLKVFEHEQLRLAGKLDQESDELWIRVEPSESGLVTPSRGRSSTVSSMASRNLSFSGVASGSPSPHSSGTRRIANGRTSTATSSPFRRLLEERPYSPTSPPFSPAGGDSGSTGDESSMPQHLSLCSVSGPQLLMVAGDGREDEAVFRWANGLGGKGIVKHVVTVSVGKRSTTEAKFTLTQGVTGLLNALGKLTKA